MSENNGESDTQMPAHPGADKYIALRKVVLEQNKTALDELTQLTFVGMWRPAGRAGVSDTAYQIAMGDDQNGFLNAVYNYALNRLAKKRLPALTQDKNVLEFAEEVERNQSATLATDLKRIFDLDTKAAKGIVESAKHVIDANIKTPQGPGR